MNPIDLIPYEDNPKQHPQKQIEHIKESIRLTGFDQPIVIDKENVIIKGHGRRLAALELGVATVPVIKLNISNTDARAARILDNKASESDWDLKLLLEELEDLNEIYTGFDEQEIDKMLATLNDSLDIDELNEEVIDFDNTAAESRSGVGDGKYLKFGQEKILISAEELKLLEDKLKDYQNQVGLELGFVNWMLG